MNRVITTRFESMRVSSGGDLGIVSWRGTKEKQFSVVDLSAFKKSFFDVIKADSKVTDEGPNGIKSYEVFRGNRKEVHEFFDLNPKQWLEFPTSETAKPIP